MAQGSSVAHVISSIHEVCGSPSTLISILFILLIFPFIFFPCTFSSTSSTSLRAVASLCTPPKRVWTLFTRPTPSQVMSLTPCDLKETYVEPKTESLTHPPFSKQGFPEYAEYDDAALEECFAKHTEYMSSLSFPARRLVCRSVVVCVRANGANCWRANGATC